MNGQRLRPLSVGDVFDEGFDLYKRHFVRLLLTGALTLAPLDIGLALAAPRLLPPIDALFGVTGSAADASGAAFLRFLTELVLFLPLYALACTPLVAATAALYLDQPVTLAQSFRLCLRRLPALFGASLLAGLMLAAGLIVCFLGWPFAATSLLFTFHALLAEGQGGGKALGRSSRLVSGHGSRVFGCLLLLGTILYTVGLGLKLPLDYLFTTGLNVGPSGLAGGPTGGAAARSLVVDTLSGGLGHLILIPFLVCVVTAQYYDLRVRKEGYDMDLLAEDLGYPPLAALGPFLPPVAVFLPPRPRVIAPPPRPPAPGGLR